MFVFLDCLQDSTQRSLVDTMILPTQYRKLDCQLGWRCLSDWVDFWSFPKGNKGEHMSSTVYTFTITFNLYSSEGRQCSSAHGQDEGDSIFTKPHCYFYENNWVIVCYSFLSIYFQNITVGVVTDLHINLSTIYVKMSMQANFKQI